METVQDTIDRVRKQLNSNILSELEGISLGNTPEETLAAIRSAPVRDAIAAQTTRSTLAGDTLGAFGIGVGSMLNNSVVGGAGLALGNVGRAVEYISPFSGWDEDTLTHLANLGMTPEEAYEISPYRDSWATSLAKGTLAVHNAFDDALKDARTQMLGTDPSTLAKIFEGSGSSIGFLLTGLLMGQNPITKAIWSGVSEALSEAGGFMGDAYRNGQYDNGAIGTADKMFLANAALNSLLNVTLGRFNPRVDAIKNPFTRWGVGSIAEMINELVQEPSQQIIEQAATSSLNNQTGFMSELGQALPNWWSTFKEIAPETAASTLLTSLLLGPGNPGDMYTKQGRRRIAIESILSRPNTVTSPEGKRLLKAHQGNMEGLRQDFANDLNAQKTSLEDIINGIYQSGNEELDTNPDMMNDVQQNSAKLKTVNEQLEALSNFGKEAQIQQTVDDVQNTLGNQEENLQKDDTVTKQTQEDMQETPPEQNVLDNENPDVNQKPKKKRKKKNTAPQQETDNTSEEPDDDDWQPDGLYLSSNEDQENELSQDELAERQAKAQERVNAQKEKTLQEFNPTEDTVNAYKAKNVAGSNTARVRTAKGTEVDVRYKIVDADELIASTTDTGSPNKNYLQALQPRDRGKQYSLEQIYRIAANPDPELLGANRMASDGAPIIGPDMMVESGNGRVLALRKAYKDNTAEGYRAYLRDNAELFGLTPEDVDRVAKPVLVRERITELDDANRVRFTSEANESSVAAMSASEHALDDAKRITERLLNSYDTELSFEANKDFIAGVIDVLPDNERGNLIQGDGNISQAGFDRVRNAMAAKAYRSSSILNRLAEVLDDEVKNISNALIQAAPKLAILEMQVDKGTKRKDLSLRRDIMKAINLFVDIKKQKKRVSDWLAQPALFEEAEEPQAVRMLLEFFDKNIRAFKRMAKGLMNYAEIAANQANTNEQVLFEDSVRSKEDILEEALRRAVEEDEAAKPAKKKSKNKNISAADNEVSPTREDIYNSNFKKWFGDWEKHPKNASKVVDDNGLPLIVYHGTDAKSENGQPPFTEFDTNGKKDGQGLHGDTEDTGAWFHSNKKAANSYGGYIYQVYLNIRNPYIYDCTGKNPKTIAKKKDQIVRDVRAGKYGEGYDGVIFRNIEDIYLYFGFSSGENPKGDVYVVFDRHQVKSADKNNGLYGLATGNVFKQSTNPNLSAKEEQLRLDFKQKIIDAHRSDEEAEQLSHIYMAANRYFSTYTGIPIDKLMHADNFSTQVIKTNDDSRGRIQFFREKKDPFDTVIQEARTIMQLTQNADSSTILHETGHIFLDKFRRLAASGMLKGKAKQDWATLVKELGMEGIDFTKPLSAKDKQRLADAHEKFATSLEKYLMTGKAPNSKLKHAFEAFKRWLTDIYYSIRNIQYAGADGQLHTFDLSPKVREVFDSMLGVDSSSDGSISNDESLISPEDVEQYNQRTYYASGQQLKNDKIDFQEMRRYRNIFDFDNAGNLLDEGPAWGLTTTQTKFQAKEYRTSNRELNKKGRIHFRNRGGKDAHEGVRQFKDKEYREDAEWVLTDLERRVDRDTTPEEFDAIKANLLETYRRVHAVNKIHFIEQITRMTVDPVSEGNLYLVDTPDDSLLLDGDLPLAKQPEHVRRAIRGIHGQLRIWGVSLWSAKEVKQNPRQKDLFGDDPEIRNEVFNASQMLDKNGMEFYGALANAMESIILHAKAKITSPKYGVIKSGRMAASILLNRFGVPGLRVKRKGFYTYTTWNEDMLRVLGVSKDSDNDTVRKRKQEEQAQERQKRKEMLAKDQPSAIERALGREGVLQEGEVRINLYGGDRGTEPSKHKVSINLADESYNQVGGEKGATALSEATGNFMITLNLKRAKLMTKAGKTPQQIRLTTGWELAPDGEWRYEFPDGKINQKKIETILPRMAKGFRFRKIFTRRQLEQNLPVSAKLNEFFDAPETFAAYPQLKDMVVTFKDKIDDGKYSGLAYGITPVDGTNIALDASLSFSAMQSVLRHEVQHLIQEIEGFARGGTEEANTLSGNLAKSVGSELIFNLTKNMSAQGQQAAVLYLKNNIQQANKLAATLSEDERKNLSSVRKIVQQIRNNKTLRLNNIYPFLGGEIEARNVQRRENFTPEQRRSTLLSETEDVHSWIIRKNSTASGQAARLTPEAQRQIDEVRQKYEGTSEWLKAPNSKQSTLAYLSDDTWLQVRTPNFKRWFGDWENNPEHASKILDENGEPRILDHATDEDFSVFDTEREGLGVDDAETPNGIFMKTDFNEAPFYRENDMFLFANIRNPFVVQNRKEVREKLKDYAPYMEALKEYDAMVKLYNEAIENAEVDDLENERDKATNEATKKLNTASKKAKRILRKWLTDNGYDGMIMKDDYGLYTVIALDKGQVKHALGNNGEYSENPDIYKQAAVQSDTRAKSDLRDNWEMFRGGTMVLTPEMQRQMKEIAKQYEGTDKLGLFDKLGNYKTNLPAWLQKFVRTPNFKRKFGDWENDPEHATKVLDEYGEPLVVWHATPNGGFSVFNIRGKGNLGSIGAWFSSSRRAVEPYQWNRDGPNPQAYPVFLDIRHPYVVDAKGADWTNINGRTTDSIAEDVFEGRLGDGSHDGVIIKNVKDGAEVANDYIIFQNTQVKSANRNNGDLSDDPDIYRQAAYSPRGFMRKIIDKVASSAKKIFAPSVKSAPSASPESIKFANEETERRYRDSLKGVQQLGLLGKIKHSTMSLIRSMKGDYPELGEGLKFAKEQFRMLQRKKSSQVKQAMQSFIENMRGLDSYQRDLFGRKRLLDDLRWRKQNYPDAELPFGFTDDMLKKEGERFDKLAKSDSAVMQAIQREEQTMKDISSEFISLAKELGLNLEGVLRNPHYYRHTVLEYANAAALSMPRSVQKSNASLQDFVDSQLRGVTGRGYLKRYRGSALDISTNYVQANGEVRAQMLMDIEVMKALGQIKKKYDIAPKLKQKLRTALGQAQQNNVETHNQPSIDDQTISDIIPEGYTLYDPAGGRLIQSANSSAENIISMAVDDAARQSGLPLDRLLRSLGSLGEDAINRLLVIPNEIALTLDKMSKARDRGMLGNAAKLLTNWWKLSVLFSPMRNMKYNVRNFTGDLDALIAGNPTALKFFPQAVKELTAHYRGKNTTQDLQDYIDRSGGLNIDSMQITPNEVNALQEIAENEPTSLGKKGWNLIKKFFKNEVAHPLRVAGWGLGGKENKNKNPLA